jgi:hypothetical protein
MFYIPPEDPDQPFPNLGPQDFVGMEVPSFVAEI